MEHNYKKTLQVGTYSVNIQISCEPYCSNENTFIWGYPMGGCDLLNDEWSMDTLNDARGYFWGFRISENKIEFANDILGGYRMYYCKLNDEIWITDDYEYLIDRIGAKNLTTDELQVKYWDKHRYTLNNNTFFKEINKFSPSSIVTIYGDKIEYRSYFKERQRKTNYKQLMEKNFSVLKEDLQKVYSENLSSKFILFYSGGADSTLLLHISKELQIPFTCVLIRYSPKVELNYNDIERASNYLKKLGLPYDIIEVDIKKAIEKYGQIAISELLFDRHLAVHFYQTYHEIREKYGKDVVIINGQSADSILSFGPSEYTVGNIAKRAILACSNNIIGFFGNLLSKALPSVGFIFPYGKTEAVKAILDDTNYIFALDKKCPYDELLDKEVEAIHKLGIQQYESMRMYAKTAGFLQGPDNQVVIHAARHNGVNKVVMPYTSPEFIYNVVQYKSNMRDILHPKYFIRDLLRGRYKYDAKDKYRISSHDEFYQNSPEFMEQEEHYMNLYKQRVRELTN